MNRKIILTVFISFHFSISVFAALPQWVKTEKILLILKKDS